MIEKRMFENVSSSDRILAIQRLTALWALNECGLGGFLHALQSPFTGLLVGSFAMICIAFICSLAENKWQSMMTSLAIVLVIKALVSPHTSPTAYIAVVFQGLTGALIYRFIPGFLFSSILFFTLGLIESAIQRLLTLAILYGNTIWEAINIWGAWVAKEWGVILPFSSSRLIIFLYLGIHFIAGILVGWGTYKMIRFAKEHWGEKKYQLQLKADDKKQVFNSNGGNKKKWRRYLLFFILTIMIIAAYLIQGGKSGIQKGLISILRSVLILTIWFVFLAPFMIRLLNKWLHKKHEQLAKEISLTMEMFPQLFWILDKAWKETRNLKMIERWKIFVLNTFLYILQYKSHDDPDPYRPDTKP